MKRFLVLVLLLSLGLNIGLGVRLWQDRGNETRRKPPWSTRGDIGLGRHGGNGPQGGFRDGAFWRGVMDRRLNQVADRLGLDEEQAESFKMAHKAAAEKFLAQRILVMEARVQLREASFKSDFETASLRPLIAEVGRQQAKLDSMVTETMLQELEILNKDQRRRYLEILPLNRFGGRHGGPANQPRSWGR